MRRATGAPDEVGDEVIEALVLDGWLHITSGQIEEWQPLISIQPVTVVEEECGEASNIARWLGQIAQYDS